VYLYLDRVSQWLSPKRHAGTDHQDMGAADDDGDLDIVDEVALKKSKVLAAE
jgi:hypothetical protein